MNFGTIRARLTATILVILALFGVAGTMVFLEVRSQGAELGHAAKELGEIAGTGLPLLVTIKDIKVDVIQVQQWLTDISATRGLDGLNDGFDEAETYANKFNEDLARARRLAMSESHIEHSMGGAGKKSDQDAILKALDRVEASFGPYYETGKRMAQAYVDYGPAEGNKMMADFDAVAAGIGEASDELVAVVEAGVTENIHHQREIAGAIVGDNNTLLWRVSVAGLIGLVTAATGAFTLFRRVSGGLGDLQNDIELLSGFAAARGGADEAELGLRLNEKRADEFGAVGVGLRLFQSRIREAKRLAAAEEAQQAERARQAELMENTVAEFSVDADAVIRALGEAATELEATAQSLTSTADETSAQSQSVASAAEQASNNVQTVATASEELGTSIGEIGRQVAQSAQIAGDAVEEARKTNRTVRGLAEAAQRIGEVVTLINDIAGQTNLLALNATIEAARAGEAGKGFAVVAQEVKNLADQTAKATGEISSQITAIQDETNDAVGAIQRIQEIIAEINDISTTIASAVEEQGVATQEIGRSVQDTARGTQQVTENIVAVSRAARDTGAASNQVLSSSQELARQTESLRARIDDFTGKVRAT